MKKDSATTDAEVTASHVPTDPAFPWKRTHEIESEFDWQKEDVEFLVWEHEGMLTYEVKHSDSAVELIMLIKGCDCRCFDSDNPRPVDYFGVVKIIMREGPDCECLVEEKFIKKYLYLSDDDDGRIESRLFSHQLYKKACSISGFPKAADF